MAKAVWHGKVLAESPSFEIVEGNVYFPPDTIDKSLFKDSATTSQCHWKGTAHYFTVAVDGAENKDAAWYYPEPLPAAAQIKNYVAFWKGVEVER
jgi:uncharacterized protein (DUF427 family)